MNLEYTKIRDRHICNNFELHISWISFDLKRKNIGEKA